MMQPHAGSPEGFHFPLRKGTEVVVIFLGGDPDRRALQGPKNETVTNKVTEKFNTGHETTVKGTQGENLLQHQA